MLASPTANAHGVDANSASVRLAGDTAHVIITPRAEAFASCDRNGDALLAVDEVCACRGELLDDIFVRDWENEAGYGELDECNGRDGVVVIEGQELSTYAYYLTYTYPYIPRCFKATPDPSFAAGPGGEAGGPPSGGGAEPPAG